MGFNYGWHTTGMSFPMIRSRVRKRGIRTPKRYETVAPYTAQERRVIEQLRAERLAKGGQR